MIPPTIAAADAALRRRIRDMIPQSWTRPLREGHPLAIGYDVATTEKDSSNPSALAVMQSIGRSRPVQMIVRWKAAEPVVSTTLVSTILDDIAAAGVICSGIGIDATSEKYFAAQLRRSLLGRCPVHMLVFTQKVQFDQDQIPLRDAAFGGYINRFQDAVISLPDDPWVYADHRLVKDFRGGYSLEEDAAGNHADAFVACALADYLLDQRSFRVEMSAAPVDGRRAPQRGLVIRQPSPASIAF